MRLRHRRLFWRTGDERQKSLPPYPTECTRVLLMVANKCPRQERSSLQTKKLRSFLPSWCEAFPFRFIRFATNFVCIIPSKFLSRFQIMQQEKRLVGKQKQGQLHQLATACWGKIYTGHMHRAPSNHFYFCISLLWTRGDFSSTYFPQFICCFLEVLLSSSLFKLAQQSRDGSKFRSSAVSNINSTFNMCVFSFSWCR